MRTNTIAIAMTLLGASCGIKRLPENLIERLPYESKIELLEAENDLALAVDELEQTQAEISRAKINLQRAKERLDAAEFEKRRAETEATKEIAALAIDEATLRVEFLRATQNVNLKNEAYDTQGLRCAEGRYELAKLLAARKAKIEGSEKFEPAVFENQIKDCEATQLELKEKNKLTTEELTLVRGKWEQAKQNLAKKTFDARASVYIE
jgi:hypothetical protein